MVSGPGKNPGSEFLREGNPGSNPGSDPDYGREVLLGQALENVWSASGKCKPFILVFLGDRPCSRRGVASKNVIGGI
jgi:hypothetical protein